MEMQEGLRNVVALTRSTPAVYEHGDAELGVMQSALLVFTNFLDQIANTEQQTTPVPQSLPQIAMELPRRSSRLRKSLGPFFDSPAAAAVRAGNNSSAAKVTLTFFFRFFSYFQLCQMKSTN